MTLQQKIAFYLFVILTLGLFTLIFVDKYSDKESVVYINNVRLFNNFTMSQDLGKKYKTEIQQSKKTFDSLLNIYQIFKSQENTSKLKPIEVQLKQIDQKIKSQENYLTNEVSQQVWNRLNVYIKDFGKYHKYQLILGTQGNGNVMYADEEKLDITEALIEYVNEKYEGN